MPRSFMFVLVLLAGSLGLNLSLAWKVKALQPPSTKDTKIGMVVKTIPTTDLTGKTTDISFNTGKPTLIYYIDPECKWCKANAQSFNSLAQTLEGNTRVIVLSSRSDKMDGFLAATHPTNTQVLVVHSDKAVHDLGLVETPQTFYVDNAGRLTHHWVGAYDHENRTDIEKTFHLQLANVATPS